MKLKALFFFILVNLSLVARTTSFHNGAPCASLENLTPDHGERSTTNPVPLKLEFFAEKNYSTSCYQIEKNLTVRISAKNGSSYKGFILQTRKRHDTKRRTAISTNCDAIKKAHTDAQSGVYEVRLFNTSSCNGVPGVVKHGSCYVNVYCDMDTFGGGWTVIQKRFNGSVDFYETWRAYDQGFGTLNGEFWAGNRLLHHLTSQDSFDLLVELYQRETNCNLYALYSSFAMNSEADKYSIRATFNNGTAGDSLIYHTGRPFSTKDRDNDAWHSNCSVSYHGAWWYGKCHHANLNGRYRDGCTSVYADHMCWSAARGYYYSFAGTEMKIRPSASHR